MEFLGGIIVALVALFFFKGMKSRRRGRGGGGGGTATHTTSTARSSDNQQRGPARAMEDAPEEDSDGGPDDHDFDDFADDTCDDED